MAVRGKNNAPSHEREARPALVADGRKTFSISPHTCMPELAAHTWTPGVVEDNLMIIQFHFLLFYTTAICSPPSMECALALIQIKLLNHSAASPAPSKKIVCSNEMRVRVTGQTPLAAWNAYYFCSSGAEGKHAVYLFTLHILHTWNMKRLFTTDWSLMFHSWCYKKS
jgi:hypothetical protein